MESTKASDPSNTVTFTTGGSCPMYKCVAIDCQHGRQKDENGCQTCECNDVGCPMYDCITFDCQHGRQKDENGCQTCDCNDAPTTGNQGGSSGAAVGVGIVVALVAVAIVAILVFIFIRRKRQQSAETVAFENPNYGSEKIQISGLNGETQHGFDYARLDESQNHEYQTVQPNLYDNSDTNNAAATLPVDTMQIHPSMHMNESGEI